MPPPRRPAPPPPVPFPVAAGPVPRRSRRGTYLFGAVYAAMLIAGFEVGFRAGAPKPTPPAKPVQVAAARPNTAAAPPDAPPPPQAEPKAKAPARKAPEPKKSEPKEPERRPMPEPPAKKVEPKPEPKPEPTKSPSGPEVAFVKVAPVFKDKCGGCHGGVNAKGGLDMRSAKSTIAGGDNGEAVKPGDPDNSLLWQEIVEGKMPPKNKPKLTDEEKKLIKEWIAGGAK